MFADDLVLISQTAEGLQNCLTNLQSYCKKWCLTVNTDKTKVVIFNRGGYKISKFAFLLNDNCIEIVQSYCYLGIMFSSTGSFSKACDALYDKALKAFYKLKRIQPQNNVRQALKLFDTLILPIVSYACVVWAPLYAINMNQDNLFDLCNTFSSEKLNLKFCKYLLGVHRKSTNAAVRGEIGRYPLLISMLNLSARYHDRIYSLGNSTLVKMSCFDHTVHAHNSSWPSAMVNLRQNFGGTLSLKVTLEQIYHESWSSYIDTCQSKGKLMLYSKLKKSFKLENYILQFPIHIRKNFSKLRISAHSLAIETGRYTKPQATPIEKRICFYCKQVETEFHFIFNCALYHAERKLLYDELSNILTIKMTPSDDLFHTIMSSLHGDLEVGRIVCNFINSCFVIRSEMLCNKRETDIYQRTKSTTTRSGRVSKRPTILDL